MQPGNVTGCLGGCATFTCIVNRPNREITSTRWQIYNEVEGFVSVEGNRGRYFLNETISNDGSTLTEHLTITNVQYSDGENLYRCHPVQSLNASNVVSITVAGNVLLYVHPYIPPSCTL